MLVAAANDPKRTSSCSITVCAPHGRVHLMKTQSFLILIALALFGALGGIGLAAQDKYSLSVLGGPGYDVTVVRDATADYSDEKMHAALDVNLPNYASAIVTAEEIVASIATL